MLHGVRLRRYDPAIAPLPTIPDTIRCAFNWLAPTGLTPATNVMHFNSTAYDMDALWTDLQAQVVAGMWLGVRSTARLNEVVMTPLDGGGASRVFTAPVTAAWQGGSGAGDIVPQVSVLVSHRTSQRGRSFRGRTYLPYISEGSIAGGIYDSSVVTSQTTSWQAFRSGMSAAGSPLVVATYKLSDSALVTQCIVRGFTATQRRRQQH